MNVEQLANKVRAEFERHGYSPGTIRKHRDPRDITFRLEGLKVYTMGGQTLDPIVWVETGSPEDVVGWTLRLPPRSGSCYNVSDQHITEVVGWILEGLDRPFDSDLNHVRLHPPLWTSVDYQGIPPRGSTLLGYGKIRDETDKRIQFFRTPEGSLMMIDSIQLKTRLADEHLKHAIRYSGYRFEPYFGKEYLSIEQVVGHLEEIVLDQVEKGQATILELLGMHGHVEEGLDGQSYLVIDGRDER